LVAPLEGYLGALRDRCRTHGALLVFDEVITGFRVGRGGAQQRTGVTPDLSIFGKVVGGGFPLAAVGGAAALMDHLAPIGPVYQAGTLSGNPVATAAGLAVLRHLDDFAYERLERTAAALVDGMAAALDKAGHEVQATRTWTLGGLFFSDRAVHDYDGAKAADHATYARFFHGLLDRGVFVAPSGYETLFPSLAHTDDDVAFTLDAVADTAAAL
jgi:glutamate-1-semialdehyde 2,1-aminomutase